MRTQLHQTHADLVAQVGRISGAAFAQRHGHGGHQRFFGQTVVLG